MMDFSFTDKNSLIALPGIGEYTSSAIMAIAFDRKSNVIDEMLKEFFQDFMRLKTHKGIQRFLSKHC